MDKQDFQPKRTESGANPHRHISEHLRQGVLVLGMHRSGTSAMSGVLAKLGCALPTDLMGAGAGNEKGHWEPQGIVSLNDELLASAGSHWEDWAPFNPDWYTSPIYPTFLDRARQRLRESFGSEPLFVLKDPRICRLTPFWISAIEAENINPLFVLCIRDPREIAESLMNRDGMEKEYAVLLWLRYSLDAEAGTRGRKRTFCNFTQLVNDWSSTTHRIGSVLNLSWPRKSALTTQEIASFLAKGRNRIVSTDTANLASIARSAYQIFERWANMGEDPADYALLDEIMTTFDKSSEIFANLILPGAFSLGPGEALAMKESFNREIEAQKAKIQTLEDEALKMQVVVDDATTRLATRTENYENEPDPRIADLENYAESLSGELTIVRDELSAEKARLAEREEQYKVLSDQYNLVENTLRQRDEEIHQTRADLIEARDLAAHHQSKIEQLQNQFLSERGKLEEANSWVFNLAKDRQAAQVEIASLKKKIDDATVKNRHLELQLDQSNGLLEKKAATNKQLSTDIRRLENSLNDAKLNITNLKDELETCERHYQERLLGKNEELAKLTKLLIEAEARQETYSNEISQMLLEIQARDRLIAEEREHADNVAAERSQALARVSEPVRENAAIREHHVATTITHVNADNESTDARLQNSLRENLVMTQLLATAEDTVARTGSHLAWLSEVNAWLANRPRWWSLLPADKKRHRERKSLKNRGLFDSSAYLQLYPDVEAAGIDPLQHFIRHGITEGRKLTR